MSIKTAFLTVFLGCLCWPASAQPAPATGSVIEGDVVDGDTGQGIPGARVSLGTEEDGPWFTSTDGAGHFRFTGLAKKGYQIAARQIGFMPPEGSPSSFGGSRRVQAGQAEPVRIELIRYAVIAGIVTDSSGEPISTAQISVLRKAPVEARVMQRPERRLADGRNRLETVGRTYTDQRGAYRVVRLRPGAYYVQAEPRHSGMPSDDRTARATYYGGALDLGGAKPIEATAGNTFANINVEILKRPGVRVSGRIVAPAVQEGRASSEPVFTSISLSSLSGESGNTNGPYASANGDRFEIQDVLPGRYTIEAVTHQRNGRPEAREELAGSIQTIEVDQTDLTGLTVALQPPRDLPGIVRLDERCHSGKVRLTVSRFGLRDVAVNPDGSFVVKNLLPSRQWLSASIEGDEFATLGAVRLGGRESEGGFMMQGEDYGPLSVDIVCPRGSVSGEVRDASGAPAEGALIALVSTVEPGDRRLVRIDQAGGRFDIPVRPGVYNVFACSGTNGQPSLSRDCQKGPGPVTIKDGTNSPVALTLPVGRPKEGSK